MCVCAKPLKSCLTLCDPIDYNLPASSVHGFSKQESWSGLPSPSSGDLPNPGIEPMSLIAPELQTDPLPLALPRKPRKESSAL